MLIVGSSWVFIKSSISLKNSSGFGLILNDLILFAFLTTSFIYFSSLLIEPGNTAENVFCFLPKDIASVYLSFKSIFEIKTTEEESIPPDKQVPTGASDISLYCTALINLSLNSLILLAFKLKFLLSFSKSSLNDE